jgi:hypothetical protein
LRGLLGATETGVSGQFCSAHDPHLPADARFGSSEQAAQAATGVRRRPPSLIELLRERVEAEAEAILAPYFEALAQGEGVEHRLQGGRARGTQGSAEPQGRVGPPGSQGDIGPSSGREASSNGGATLNREPTVILNPALSSYLPIPLQATANIPSTTDVTL